MQTLLQGTKVVYKDTVEVDGEDVAMTLENAKTGTDTIAASAATASVKVLYYYLKISVSYSTVRGNSIEADS